MPTVEQQKAYVEFLEQQNALKKMALENVRRHANAMNAIALNIIKACDDALTVTTEDGLEDENIIEAEER